MVSNTTLTRFAILAAADELCSQKSYKDVTLAEICDAANISKSTFYRCFESTRSIATWFADLAITCSYAQIGRTLTWQEGLMADYEVYYLASNLMSSAICDFGLDSVMAHYRRRVSEVFVDTLENHCHVVVDRSLRYQIDFFLSHQLVGDDRWSVRANELTAEEIVDMTIPCIPRDLFAALNTPTDPRPMRPLSLSSMFSIAEDMRYE